MADWWPTLLTGKRRRRRSAPGKSSAQSVSASRRLGLEALEARLLLSNGAGHSPSYGWDGGDPFASEIESIPQLAWAQTGRNTRVIGGLQAAPGATFTLEFFAGRAGEESGTMADDRSLGRLDVTTDSAGHAPFNALLEGSTTVGEFVRAAATGWAFTDTAKFSDMVLAVVGAVAVFDTHSAQLGIFGADEVDAIELSVSASGEILLSQTAGPVPTVGGIADVQHTSKIQAALGENDDSFVLLGDNRLRGIEITVSGEAGNDVATVVMPPEPCSAGAASCGSLVFDGGAGDADTLEVFTTDLAEEVAISLEQGGESQSLVNVAVADRATQTATGAFTALGVENVAVSTGGGDDVVTANLAGDAVLTTAGASVRVDGGAGNDTINVTATGFMTGRVELFGGQGDDLLMLLAPDAGNEAYLATDGGTGVDRSTTTANVQASGFEDLDVVDLLQVPHRADGELVAALEPAQLQPLVEEAIALLSGAATTRSDPVSFHVADLPGSVLGMASRSGRVWVDRDAAGFGWFLGGSVSTVPPGRIDLLSTVSHELGHVLGMEHDGGLMGATLLPGVRRLPERASVVEGLGNSPIDFSDAFGAMPLLLGESSAAGRGAGSDVGVLLDELAPGLVAGAASRQKIQIPQPGKWPSRSVLDDAFTEIGALRMADERMLDEALLDQLAAGPGGDSATSGV